MRWAEIAEATDDRIIFTNQGAKCKMEDAGDCLLLHLLRTSKDSRGKGYAKDVMHQAISYADKHGKEIQLAAAPDDEKDLDRLIKFYQSFGFELTPSEGNMFMTRPASR